MIKEDKVNKLNCDLKVPSKNDYMKIVREAVDYNMKECDSIIQGLKSEIRQSPLFGYTTPFYPATFAELLGFMYEQTGEEKYVSKAVEMLLSYEEFKKLTPEKFYKDRIEYSKGLPPLSDFFTMYSYPKAYLYIKDSNKIRDKDREIIKKGIADCSNFLMNYPEWGPMNRTVIRAEILYYSYLALPDHSDSGIWEKMAGILIRDSYQQWEEEDATGYHAVWLRSLLRTLDVLDDKNYYRSAIPRYYFDYFANLITPHGTVPEFGDANWPADWDEAVSDDKAFVPFVTYNVDYVFLSVFEKAAAEYKEPLYKWAAAKSWENIKRKNPVLTSTYSGLTFADAYKWADKSIKPEPPESTSRLVMEDIIGKKVVFRNDTANSGTYLLLNYRDEGDGAFSGREFMRTTICAEEEKAHHGHADENSVSMLFFNGSVLLHDAGYRDGLPSGEYGRFRADYFHNRIVTRKDKRWKQTGGENKEQPLWEFIRNSGAYRPVNTKLIDFLKFEKVDYSRTRLTDKEIGCEWDRNIFYHKEDGFFVVLDSVQALRDDFFTFSNLWHTRNIVAQNDSWFDTSIDRIGTYRNPGDTNLLICFPLKEEERSTGTFNLKRHFQDEITMYETVSSFYYAQHMEVFATILLPHNSKDNPEKFVNKFKFLNTEKFPFTAGIKYTGSGSEEYFGVKNNLRMDNMPQNVKPRYSYDRGRENYGPFETDGHMIYGKIEGEELYYACSNMAKVLYKNKIIHEGLESSVGLQPDGQKPRTGRAKWRCWESRLTGIE